MKADCYVYVSYGIHRMLNISAGTHGMGSGVMIRADEPLGTNVRIGITKEAHRPLRFERGSKFVSGPERLNR